MSGLGTVITTMGCFKGLLGIQEALHGFARLDKGAEVISTGVFGVKKDVLRNRAPEDWRIL